MTELVTRLYATDAKARDVVAALAAEGFPANRIALVPAGSAPALAAERVDGLATGTSARVLARSDLAALADAVSRGAALVSVSPPFGAAYAAEQVMGRDDAEPAAERGGVERVIEGDDPAPLSAALHLPVLTEQAPDLSGNPKLVSEPAPLSHALGLPVLTRSSKKTNLLPNDWSLSRLLGLPLLTKEQASAPVLTKTE